MLFFSVLFDWPEFKKKKKIEHLGHAVSNMSTAIEIYCREHIVTIFIG